MNAYRSIFLEGINKGEFKGGNLDESTVLFSTWLGGLCQLTMTQDLKSLEPLFRQAISIFLKEIKEGGT